MTGEEFKTIRVTLGLSQSELARVLGYRHKIRISEYERATNRVAVPDHVAAIMTRLHRTGGKAPAGRLIRRWDYRGWSESQQ